LVHRLCAEIQKAFKGRIPELMRHPCGSAVVIDLFAAASTEQRNRMAAEFYGREFQLFDAKEGDKVHSLTEKMSGMTATQRKATLQHLTIQLSPIMEKGLLDSELVHRWVSFAPLSMKICII
jgi:pumilio family protein 6